MVKFVPHLQRNMRTMANKSEKKESSSYVTQQEFQTLSNTVSGIPGSLSTWKVISGCATAAVLAAIGWSIHIGIKIAAIEQSLSDNGVKLVAELKSPKSMEQLKANLSTVVAQIRTAQVNAKPPDPGKTKVLSRVLSEVVTSQPQLPEAWSAAAELVSYETQGTREPVALPPCDIKNAEPESRQVSLPNGGTEYQLGYFLSKCSLRLEDVPNMVTSAKHPIRNLPGIQNGGRGGMSFPLRLTDGEVIYDGGPIAHEAGFIFQNCIFHIHILTVPDKPGRDLIEAALQNDEFVSTFEKSNAPLQPSS